MRLSDIRVFQKSLTKWIHHIIFPSVQLDELDQLDKGTFEKTRVKDEYQGVKRFPWWLREDSKDED